MVDSDFIEKCINSEKVFSGRLLHVFKDVVTLPGGRESVREYIKHPGAAVVIPQKENGSILMVKQYRYPVGRVMLELPAGKLDPGEDPKTTMSRELREETSFTAERIVKITDIHTCVGYSSELLTLFWADTLSPSKCQPDLDETIEVVEVDINDVLEKMYSNDITDAKTIIGLFWADKIINDSSFRKRFLD